MSPRWDSFPDILRILRIYEALCRLGYDKTPPSFENLGVTGETVWKEIESGLNQIAPSSWPHSPHPQMLPFIKISHFAA